MAGVDALLTPTQRREVRAESILYALPDAEFLTVLEHTVVQGYREQRFTVETSEVLLTAADNALQAHGTPYRRGLGGFEWVGDAKHHELVIEPALLALADARLEGARGEFEEALRKRRFGAPKDFEDAVDEAAKAVESVLQVLHDEYDLKRPRNQQISSLFDSLVSAKVLPGYVDKIVAAAAGPRNHMASHGQGGTPREVPEQLADASIAAAATAITFLAHYLP